MSRRMRCSSAPAPVEPTDAAEAAEAADAAEEVVEPAEQRTSTKIKVKKLIKMISSCTPKQKRMLMKALEGLCFGCSQPNITCHHTCNKLYIGASMPHTKRQTVHNHAIKQ
jgi:hypothetical protein